MSATTVPIQPLARGSVLKLWLGLAFLALAAAALAWWGTRTFQPVTLDSGVRYRVVEEGNGPTITPADLFALRYRLRVNDLEAPVIEDSDQMGQPLVETTQNVYPGFGEALQHMQAGGKYIVWVPPGQHVQGPIRPGTPFTAQDTLVFEIEVLQIAPGMAAFQQMMGAPGGPGGGVPEGLEPEAGEEGAAPPPEATEGDRPAR